MTTTLRIDHSRRRSFCFKKSMNGRARRVSSSRRAPPRKLDAESGRLRLAPGISPLADGQNGLGGVVGDLDTELFLERHHQFDGVERIAPGSSMKFALSNLVGFDPEVFDNNLFHALGNIAHLLQSSLDFRAREGRSPRRLRFFWRPAARGPKVARSPKIPDRFPCHIRQWRTTARARDKPIRMTEKEAPRHSDASGSILRS